MRQNRKKRVDLDLASVGAERGRESVAQVLWGGALFGAGVVVGVGRLSPVESVKTV
jgi:hypothetical protein